MMKRSSYILSLILAVLTLGGCHSAVFSDLEADCGPGSLTVRITATIAQPASRASLKAFDTPFIPEAEKAESANESRVDYMYVQVYPVGAADTAAPVGTYLFYTTPVNYFTTGTDFSKLGTLTASGAFAENVPTNDGKNRTLSFDMELAPGDYDFFIFVNDQNLKNLIEGVTGATPVPATKADLKTYPFVTQNDAPVLTSKELAAGRMPMLGMDAIHVPDVTATEANPYRITNPVIKLERIYAKVSLTFVNAAYDAATSTETLNQYYMNLIHTVDKAADDGAFITLVDYKKRHTLAPYFLPTPYEYTATGKRYFAQEFGPIASTGNDNYAWYYLIQGIEGAPGTFDAGNINIAEPQYITRPYTSVFAGGTDSNGYYNMGTFSTGSTGERPTTVTTAAVDVDGDNTIDYQSGEKIIYYITPMLNAAGVATQERYLSGLENNWSEMPFLYFSYTQLTLGTSVLPEMKKRTPIYTNGYAKIYDMVADIPEIRRNTVYNYNLTLTGTDLLVTLDLLDAAGDYQDRTVTIPTFN